MRAVYDSTRHPRVFAARLRRILAGEKEPEAAVEKRDLRAMQIMLKL